MTVAHVVILPVKYLGHMFVECNLVSDVWNQLHVWSVKNELEPFSKRDIILGIKDVDIVVNLCIQVARLSIYRCRLNNSRPTMAAVKANIKYTMYMENIYCTH
jgi:hypothetical protein